MTQKSRVVVYPTTTINDFSVLTWEQFADDHAWLGQGVELTGARNKGTEEWHDPYVFSHGKGCKERVQQAMRDTAVELKLEYVCF